MILTQPQLTNPSTAPKSTPPSLQNLHHDILSHIFTIAFTSIETFDEQIQFTLRISHLCQHCRTVSISTAVLWHILSDTMPEHILQIFIQRSHLTRLQIISNNSIDPSSQTHQQRLQSTYALVRASPHLISALHCTQTSSTKALAQALNTGTYVNHEPGSTFFPNLLIMVLRSKCEDVSQFHTTIVAPALRDLTVEHTLPPLQAFKLQTIHISFGTTHVYQTWEPTPLLHALQSFPSLHRLHLRLLNLFVNQNTTLPTVSCPAHDVHLTAGSPDDGFLRLLFQALKLPNIENLNAHLICDQPTDFLNQFNITSSPNLRQASINMSGSVLTSRSQRRTLNTRNVVTSLQNIEYLTISGGSFYRNQSPSQYSESLQNLRRLHLINCTFTASSIAPLLRRLANPVASGNRGPDPHQPLLIVWNHTDTMPSLKTIRFLRQQLQHRLLIKEFETNTSHIH